MPDRQNTAHSLARSFGLRGLTERLLALLPARHAPVNRMVDGGSTMQTGGKETMRAEAADAAQPGGAVLRLLALDAEDLDVLSCHLQDAVVRVGDLAWLPGQRRFALLTSRFDWCAAEAGRMERSRAGLHFDHVLKVASTGFDRSDREAVLNLLSVAFEPGDAPAGVVVLTFSGGAGIRLEVECVDAQMRDLGERWTTRRQPGHEAHDAAHDGAHDAAAAAPVDASRV